MSKGGSAGLSRFRASVAAGVVLTLAAFSGLVGAVGAEPASANSAGSSMYTRGGSTDEFLAYSRVIRLEHSGAANGTLLGTFEHADFSGGAASLLIRRSTDDGATWSTIATVGDPLSGSGHPSSQMWQPFLFEFPTAMGSYPAGTLLLIANIAPSNNLTTSFVSWRSTDGGVTWAYISNFQNGGGTTNGIWEPFLATDSSGNLIAYFSDERQSGTYSQKLSHIVSTDGGVTWSANPDGTTRVSPGLVDDVASSTQSDRPGMVAVAHSSGGVYVMAFEACGPTYGCVVHIKTSTNGTSWGSGPTDMGTTPTTSDGRTLLASPYIVWTPAGGADGQFVLTGRVETSGSGESGQVMFTNANNASGSWSWTPAPFRPSWDNPNCAANYSPHLLVSASGRSVRYTTATGVGSTGCAEGTAQSGIGLLPFASTFDGGDQGWINYNGCWSTSSGVYSDTCGGTGGSKAVAGSTSWTDYTLQGDVKVNSGTEAGFIFRVADPDPGANDLDGYYVGVNSTQIFLGRMAHNWTPLTSVSIPGGLALNTWYHLTIQAVGCDFVVSGLPSGSTASPVSFTYTDTGCTFTKGAIGLRDYDSPASWRNVTVVEGGTTSTGTLPYAAPFASGSSSGWTPYGGTWSASGGAYVDSAGGAGDKSVAGSAGWVDYSLSGEVQLNTTTGGSPNAGFITRVTSPAVGVDALKGYYVGVWSGGLMLGRQDNSWTSLASVSLPVALAAGAWYHLTIEAVGCELMITGVPSAGGAETSMTYTDTGCTLTNGAIGVRTFNTTAGWRSVTVSPR